MEMSQYRKQHGTDFDREDELIATTKKWRDLALQACEERDAALAEVERLKQVIIQLTDAISEQIRKL